MATRIQNLSEKSFDQGGPAISVAHFARSYSSWWNSNEPQASQSPPKGGNSNAKEADQLLQKAKHLGFQLPVQESSSAQSPGQSCQEMCVGGGINSNNRSLSSESDQDRSCGRSSEAQSKPFFLFGSSELVFNGSQADQNLPTVRVSYPPAGDSYFGGLVSAYGLPALLQGSQMTGVASARVPLPLTVAEDGPIFVNAKQYHGILRRRQSRAKLEAQNKLVKARKPYLHESRHRHALNRVRGSGGRFLSKQKLQETTQFSGSCVTDAANSRKEPGVERASNREGEEVFYGKPDDRLFRNSHPAVIGGKSSLALD